MSFITKLNRLGQITSGEYSGWTVRIDDDRDESGGFLILYWLDESDKGFDDWVRDEEQLEKYFAESGWLIEWS